MKFSSFLTSRVLYIRKQNFFAVHITSYHRSKLLKFAKINLLVFCVSQNQNIVQLRNVFRRVYDVVEPLYLFQRSLFICLASVIHKSFVVYRIFFGIQYLAYLTRTRICRNYGYSVIQKIFVQIAQFNSYSFIRSSVVSICVFLARRTSYLRQRFLIAVVVNDYGVSYRNPFRGVHVPVQILYGKIIRTRPQTSRFLHFNKLKLRYAFISFE